MYIEAEYICNQFQKNFIENQTCPIIIYGTGLNTKSLLEKVKSSKIIGLMDDKKTGEILWGYKVLSYEDVAQIDNVIIVIIARNAVINVIYRRIENFCSQNNICVYNIHGKKLSERNACEENHPCFELKEEDLRKKIETHDIISFDIFDTLLMRKIMRPRDIFSVMDFELSEKKYVFSKERIAAEDSFEQGYNPNIFEIYERLGKILGIDEEEVQELMELEISTEKRFLTKRTKMCELFHRAVEMGKEVYIVSDMYFPKEIMTELLGAFGIRGYKEIFVSCDYRQMKQQGLFVRYKEIVEKNYKEKNVGDAKNSYLHIGDNYYSDIIAAQYAGIETYQIYSAQEMLESSVYAKSLQQCKNVEENIALSIFAEKAFNNPFRTCEKNGKLILKDTKEIVGLFIAPVIYKYVIWMVQAIQKQHCDFVLFPSRDGYLIQSIYKKIKEKNAGLNIPEDMYIYTSRRAALIAAAENEEDIEEIKNFIFVQGKGELLKERFGINIDGDQDISNNCLLQKCITEQKTYKSYLEKLELYKYKKIAFMDFVAMGTVQEAMERILEKPLVGFYFLRRLAEKKKLESLNCHSLYKPAGDFQIDANIYRFYYFLEAIITSYEPTFWGISEQGAKTFYAEKRDAETIEVLKKMHGEILDYCDSFLDLLSDVSAFESQVDIYDGLLGYFSADFSAIENEELSKLINIDEFMGKVVTELNR